MTRLSSALLLVPLLAAGPAAAALPESVAGEPLPTLAPMLERVTPAVVNIATRGRVVMRENPLLNDPFFRRFFDLPSRPRMRRTQSLGSGVVIDADNGYVLTNHHVVARAEEITVTLRDGRELEATLVGSDPDADIAVIRVPAEDLTAVPMADSDALRVGDFVVAIGNPFGLGQTVTSGIVSALGRSGLGIEGFEDFIQTDASINPGNSGGALVNLRGELVGINTAILAPSGGNIGIGFAIPSNLASDLMQQLVEHGEVRRGGLGIVVQDLTPELAEAFGLETRRGVLVSEVRRNSPAARAGLRPGDVIVEADGRPVRRSDQLRNAIGLKRIGQSLALRVVRDGRAGELEVAIAAKERRQIDGGQLLPRFAGARFSDLGEDHPLYGQLEGVLVSEVERGSRAWITGLRDEDIILSVNRRRVRSVDDLLALELTGGRILLNVQRGQSALFILNQ